MIFEESLEGVREVAEQIPEKEHCSQRQQRGRGTKAETHSSPPAPVARVDLSRKTEREGGRGLNGTLRWGLRGPGKDGFTGNKARRATNRLKMSKKI